MSNFTHAAYHPHENLVRAANFIDDHFGTHAYGVSFPGDSHVYRSHEVVIPLDMVFVPRQEVEDDKD